jgi:hypothetical protein
MRKQVVKWEITTVGLVISACITGLAAIFQPATGGEVCELVFTSCPENFNGDTINVSQDIIAVSKEILACEPSEVREGVDTTVIDSGGPPSVIFLIDNSGSMTGSSQQAGHDRWGSRYTVVSALLDTIYKTHPEAEVGVVVFRDYLYFDNRSSDYFARHFVRMPQTYDGNEYQAYLPLMRLDQTYSGRTGLQIVNDVLDTARLDNNGFEYIDLSYEPEFAPTEGYTNINVGFLAVQEAMKSATYPKDRQFVIFFSDGEANDGSGRFNAGRDKEWYQQGQNAPTTFTVFFNDPGVTTAPQSIVNMTNNIKNNGYSSTNPRSDLWTITTSHDALLQLLTEQVIGFIVDWTPIVSIGVPTGMQVNAQNPQTKTDTSFVFSQRFALQPDMTNFNLRIEYEYTNRVTQAKRDSTVTASFVIVRSAGASLPQGVIKRCWTQPSIDILYEGETVVGGHVDETMDQLQVRLNPNDEPLTAGNVTVASELESEGLNLPQTGDEFAGEFYRYIAETPVRDDKKLQHKIAGDSIIVIWRNPSLPLDTVRVAVPFRVGRTLEAEKAYYFDNDGDGYVDSIFVDMNVDNLVAEDLDEIKKLVTLPPGRTFSDVRYVAVPGGFAILVEENTEGAPRTGVDAQDVLTFKTGVFEHGGLMADSRLEVEDRMAPVILNATLVVGPENRDTLKIVFSEPVNQTTSPQPFRFRISNGNEYEVTLQQQSHSDEDYSFVVTKVAGVDEQSKGDSIWINIEGNIIDVNGNKQSIPENRRASLGLRIPPFTVTPYTANNPFRYDKGLSQIEANQIQQSINYVTKVYNDAGVALPNENGPIVMVKPEGLLRNSTELSGTVSIFDVVKNTIIENHLMAFDPDTKQLVYMWDGRNSNGKAVATGTYVAVMTINDGQGKAQTKTVRIGVKR